MALQPPRRVLIAVDGSPTSLYTVQWFKDWFVKDRDDVVFFHCSEPESYISFFNKSSISKSDPQERVMDKLELLEHLEDTVQSSPFKCLVVHVTSPSPGEQIVKACDQHKIDVVILGSRGARPPSKKATVGSVAHYVMQHAKLPTVLCQIPPEVHAS